MHVTQLQVELDAELGTGYLQRLESGRVRQPERLTLQRILYALGAQFNERRDVLEAFGYTVRIDPPTPRHYEWAISLSWQELAEFPFPAYVLDCRHRLVSWNKRFPLLLGPNKDLVVASQLTDRSFLGTWFDPGSPLYPLIAEPDDLYPALLRAFRHEMRQYQYASWYEDVMDELRQFPLFVQYWDRLNDRPQHTGAGRALVPLRLVLPDGAEARFRLSAEPFTRDSRFRIVYYFPDDAETFAICENWYSVAT